MLLRQTVQFIGICDDLSKFMAHSFTHPRTRSSSFPCSSFCAPHAFVSGPDAVRPIYLESAVFMFHMRHKIWRMIGSTRAACSLAPKRASGLPLSATNKWRPEHAGVPRDFVPLQAR